jgi:uncharacterized membrane-anchored protein YitT (DUF2179 family)
MSFLAHISQERRRLFPLPKVLLILLGSAILSFGIYNIHRQTGITEGGVLGMLLFLNHWIGLSPSILSPMLDTICYLLGFRFLGKDFLKTSIFSTLCFAGFSRLWESFPPALPNLSNHPLVAALVGGLFVGIGCGIIIRQGGSSGGDDALALVISKLTHCRISRAYLATDITVLILSLTYIPFQRIAFSLITVTLSSFLIDFVQTIGKGRPSVVNQTTSPSEDM